VRANINAQTTSGRWTALFGLHIKVLLEAGANPMVTSHDDGGQIPMDGAQQSRDHECIEILQVSVLQ